jgi:glutathione synthase/RimK-type ligase-like ATP-grasp enzyme
MQLRLQGSTFRPRVDDVVINWGNTNPPVLPRGPLGLRPFVYLNEPDDIVRASNKLRFFELMREADCLDIVPEFWTNREDIPDNAFPVVCRTVLAGHSGEGIVIANNREELVAAPLYVKYIKKQEEYRIHVGLLDNDETTIISQQQKRRRRETPDDQVNWQVRNHQNGFIYARDGVNPPQAVIDAARRALLTSGLDFGAVDVIWNERHQRAYVLEINTAPGLEGTTLNDYVRFFTNV